ncbi:MAG: lysophospholipid acyltransferase family protein [Jhaorihella sp.]
MNATWEGGEYPGRAAIGPAGWALAVLRGLVLAVLVFGNLAVLLLVRLVERPFFAPRRPVSPFITQFVCRNAFRVLGMGFSTTGELMRAPGAVVANHSSWLDIFALNARKRIYFVSKAEVARWPAIGWLARATGTVFIDRDPRLARQQTRLFEERLQAGHKLLFFPEGTSSDGLRVLPFKPTLFQAFYSEHLREFMQVQPVAVIYHAPRGRPTAYYGWWGSMAFAPHLLTVLTAWRQGAVELAYLEPLRVADFSDRKALAAECERRIRACHSARLGQGAEIGD